MNIVEDSKHVTYVRMSVHLRQFLRIKYGGEPLEFPEGHSLNSVLDKCLVRNPLMKPLSTRSYSEAAFEYEEKGQIDDIENDAPSEQDRVEFICVALPEVVMKYSMCVKTDGFWQLSKVGVQRFSQEANNEFWNDCMNFIKECFTRAQARCQRMTIEDAISDFMLAYDIPMECYENMLRYQRRMSIRIGNEIDEKRKMMQRRSGTAFIYTALGENKLKNRG